MAKTATTKRVEKPKSLLTIVDVEQGSEEWFAARLGLVTASHFGTVMANGRDGGPSLTRTELLHRLAAERITGEPTEETYKSKAMERGKAMEPLAVEDYERRKGVEVRRVGLGINFSDLKRCGASPDGLVGFDGGLETKTMRPDLMIPLILKGSAMLPEHRAQVQGNIMVFDREWWDLKVFWPKMPDYTVRVHRDDVYIKELSNQIEIFNHDLNSLVDRLKRMGAIA